MNAPDGTTATPPSPPAMLSRRKIRWHWIAAFFAVLFACLGLAIWIVADRGYRGCRSRPEADMQTLATQLDTYQMVNNRYPTTAQGFRALVEEPTTEPRPRQWYQQMSAVLKDPWGNEYAYVCPGVKNPNSFDIFSKGKDGIAGTSDDIVHEHQPRRARAAR